MGSKILLCGGTGTGKTTIATYFYEKYENVHCIDGDVLRKQTNNTDYSLNGRLLNVQNARKQIDLLDKLGKHIIVSMQVPTKELREKYFHDFLIIKLTNSNNTKKIKNEIKIQTDWSDVPYTYEYTQFKENPDVLDSIFYPKILVIGRFQPLHKGHHIPIEYGFNLSPNVTVAVRKEDGDLFELDEVKNSLLTKYPFSHIIFTPPIAETDWSFVENYDGIVQGNPEVIKKIKPYNDEIYFIERIGDISGTAIRNRLLNK